MVDEYFRLFSVAISIKNTKGGWSWALAGIYGPNVAYDRKFLWEELARLYFLWELP